MNNFSKNNKKYIFLFLLPSIIGFVIFSFIPMLSAVFLSFTNWDVIGGMPDLIGFENYINIFTTDEFYIVMGNTLEYIVLYIPSIIILSLIVAMLFNSDVKGISVYRVLLFIPVLTSWVAGALIWKSVLNTQYGLINNFLAIFNITGPAWLTSPKWAMKSIVMVSVWKDLGFFSLIIFGGLRGIDNSIYEAAKIDGANKFELFKNITVPLVSPTLFFVLITTIINSFQLFPQVMVMTGGGPQGSTQVMVERIYTYGIRYYQMGYATALSVILLIIIVTITLIQMKLQRKWVHYE